MKLQFNINDKMIERVKTLVKKNRIIIGIFSVILVGSIIVYAAEPVELEYVFNEGEVISAQQVNANFAALQDKINELNSEIQELRSNGGSLTGAAPVGTIMPFAGPADQVPEGWLLCNGDSFAVSPGNDYYSLFEVIGTRWGGDGSTFNVPDLRGRFLRGVDSGANVDPNRTTRTNREKTATLGDVVGSYQDDALQLHQHNSAMPTRCDDTSGDGGQKYHGGTWYVPTDVFSSNQVTGRRSTETRPTNAAVNYIIKY